MAVRGRMGGVSTGTIIAIALGVSAAVGAYSYMTGNTLCSLTSSIVGGSCAVDASAQTVGGGGCPLSQAERSQIAERGADLQSELELAATVSDAKSKSCCPLTASNTKTAQAASSCSSGDASSRVAASSCPKPESPKPRVSFTLVSGGSPIAAPVLTSACGSKRVDCSSSSANVAYASGGCGGESISKNMSEVSSDSQCPVTGAGGACPMSTESKSADDGATAIEASLVEENAECCEAGAAGCCSSEG